MAGNTNPNQLGDANENRQGDFNSLSARAIAYINTIITTVTLLGQIQSFHWNWAATNFVPISIVPALAGYKFLLSKIILVAQGDTSAAADMTFTVDTGGAPTQTFDWNDYIPELSATGKTVSIELAGINNTIGAANTAVRIVNSADAGFSVDVYFVGTYQAI